MAEQLEMRTEDLSQEKIRMLGELFPNCITESREREDSPFSRLRCAETGAFGSCGRWSEGEVSVYLAGQEQGEGSGECTDHHDAPSLQGGERRFRQHEEPLYRRGQPRGSEDPEEDLPRQGQDDLHRSAL